LVEAAIGRLAFIFEKPAACERARRSRSPADAAQARRLAAGLLKCASVSDVPGFIARGVGTDGACRYPLGSDVVQNDALICVRNKSPD